MPRPLGFKESEKTKSKQRLNNKGKHHHGGINNPFYGKNHSIKTKKILSKIFKKKYIGKGNPNYNNHILKGHKLTPDQCIKIQLSKIGKNNPSWIDGRSYIFYPKEFNESLKEKIRLRDKHICQYCKLHQKCLKNKFKKRLEIHHIDYNRNNCIDTNLITLCSQCNIMVNKNRNHWKKHFNNIINKKYPESKGL